MTNEEFEKLLAQIPPRVEPQQGASLNTTRSTEAPPARGTLKEPLPERQKPAPQTAISPESEALFKRIETKPVRMGMLDSWMHAPQDLYSEIKEDPGRALANAALGVASGATLGASKLLLPKIDPDSWAGTAGEVVGSLNPLTWNPLVRGAGRLVTNAIGREALAGAAAGGAHQIAGSLSEGELPTGGQMGSALIGGAIFPPAFRYLGAGVRKLAGKPGTAAEKAEEFYRSIGGKSATPPETATPEGTPPAGTPPGAGGGAAAKPPTPEERMVAEGLRTIEARTVSEKDASGKIYKSVRPSPDEYVAPETVFTFSGTMRGKDGKSEPRFFHLPDAAAAADLFERAKPAPIKPPEALTGAPGFARPSPVRAEPGSPTATGTTAGLMAEPAGLTTSAKPGAPSAPAVVAPEAAPAAGPAWLQENIAQEVQNADRLGVADDIERLSAQRLTADQVARTIAGRMPNTAPADVKTMVRAVRSARGIPSMDAHTEFETWRTGYMGRRAPVEGSPPATALEPTEATPAVTKEQLAQRIGGDPRAPEVNLAPNEAVAQAPAPEVPLPPQPKVRRAKGSKAPAPEPVATPVETVAPPAEAVAPSAPGAAATPADVPMPPIESVKFQYTPPGGPGPGFRPSQPENATRTMFESMRAEPLGEKTPVDSTFRVRGETIPETSQNRLARDYPFAEPTSEQRFSDRFRESMRQATPEATREHNLSMPGPSQPPRPAKSSLSAISDFAPAEGETTQRLLPRTVDILKRIEGEQAKGLPKIGPIKLSKEEREYSKLTPENLESAAMAQYGYGRRVNKKDIANLEQFAPALHARAVAEGIIKPWDTRPRSIFDYLTALRAKGYEGLSPAVRDWATRKDLARDKIAQFRGGPESLPDMLKSLGATDIGAQKNPPVPGRIFNIATINKMEPQNYHALQEALEMMGVNLRHERVGDEYGLIATLTGSNADVPERFDLRRALQNLMPEGAESSKTPEGEVINLSATKIPKENLEPIIRLIKQNGGDVRMRQGASGNEFEVLFKGEGFSANLKDRPKQAMELRQLLADSEDPIRQRGFDARYGYDQAIAHDAGITFESLPSVRDFAKANLEVPQTMEFLNKVENDLLQAIKQRAYSPVEPPPIPSKLPKPHENAGLFADDMLDESLKATKPAGGRERLLEDPEALAQRREFLDARDSSMGVESLEEKARAYVDYAKRQHGPGTSLKTIYNDAMAESAAVQDFQTVREIRNQYMEAIGSGKIKPTAAKSRKQSVVPESGEGFIDPNTGKYMRGAPLKKGEIEHTISPEFENLSGPARVIDPETGQPVTIRPMLGGSGDDESLGLSERLIREFSRIKEPTVPKAGPEPTGDLAASLGSKELAEKYLTGVRGASKFISKFRIPERLFSGHPTTREVVFQTISADHLESTTVDQLGAAAAAGFKAAGATRPEMDRLRDAMLEFQKKPTEDLVNYLRSTESPASFARMDAARQNTQKWMETIRQHLVDIGRLEPGQNIFNYLPNLRERVVEPGKLKLEVGGDFRTVSSWAHKGVSSMITKKRVAEDIPEKLKNMPLEEIVDTYIKMAARVIANDEEVIHGGIRDAAGKIVLPAEGEKTWLEKKLVDVPDHLAGSMATYLNDGLGHPREGFFGMSKEFSGALRKLNFARTIGGSIMAPLVNLSQGVMTMAGLKNPFNWFTAVKHDLGGERVFQGPDGAMYPLAVFAERFLGSSGNFLSRDHLMIDRMPNMVDRVNSKLGWLFSKSESFNQRTTTGAGYIDHFAPGTTEFKWNPEAVHAAKELNNRINKFGGRWNTPEAFRTPEGALVGQFKPFMLGYMEFFNDTVLKAPINGYRGFQSNGVNGMLRALQPAATYIVGLSLLGGPQMIMTEPGVEWADKTFNTNLKEFPNLFGAIGFHLASQVGVGSSPIIDAMTEKDLRSLMWFLPGPAIGMVLDGMSVASYLMDTVGDPEQGGRRGKNFDLDKISERVGLTPDDFMSKVVRAFPMGAQLDKVRKWAKTVQTGGPEVAATTLREASGLDVPTGVKTWTGRDPYSAMGLGSLVAQPEERIQEIKIRGEAGDADKDYKRSLSALHDLWYEGNYPAAASLQQEFSKRYNGTMELKYSKSAWKAAEERHNQKSVDRALKHAAKPVQRYINEKYPDFAGR